MSETRNPRRFRVRNGPGGRLYLYSPKYPGDPRHGHPWALVERSRGVDVATIPQFATDEETSTDGWREAWIVAGPPAGKEYPHRIDWMATRLGLESFVHCSAAVGANCRLECEQGCDGGCLHELVDGGRCLGVEWLLESGVQDGYQDAAAPLRSGPVEVFWDVDGERWAWRYPE